MIFKPFNRSSLLYALVVFAILLVCYIRTLMPGTVGGDAGELQYAGPLLALVHPTGQPLYVLLGKLWSAALPVGSIAYRMNLLAAVSAAAGCAALAWFVGRIYGLPVIGAAAGLTLGFGATVWGQAVLADKYGFNVLLASLVIGLALWWDRVMQARRSIQQLPAVKFVMTEDLPLMGTFAGSNNAGTRYGVSLPSAGATDRLLYILCFAFGVGLLHHRSLALFSAGITIMIVYHLRAELWRKPRRTLICIGLAFVPSLMIYPTVLPWLQSREQSPLLWQPQTLGEWVDYLLERHVLSGEALVFDDAASISQQVEIYVETALSDYTPVVAAIALLGMLVMLRRYPMGVVFLVLSYSLQAFLSANFRGNERQFTYYLPSFVTLVYGYACGLVWLWEIMKRYRMQLAARRLRASLPEERTGLSLPAPPHIHATHTGNLLGHPFTPMILLGMILLVALPVYQLVGTYPDRRLDARYGEPLDLWRQTLKTGNMGERLIQRMADLPQNAVVAADWEQVTILWYAQRVEGIRPDLKIVYPIERYADYENLVHPICLARHAPIGEQWHPTNVGALICLGREPGFELAPDFTPIGTPLQTPGGDRVMELAAYQSNVPVYRAGTHAPLVLAWRALADLDADYSISLHVLDEGWQQVWSRDILSPVMGMYPTSRWVEGEIVQDYHEIDIAPTIQPGRYLWTVVVYEVLGDGTFVQLRDSEGNINILGSTFEVVAG